MLKLLDPNGVTVATNDTGELRFPVSLQTIDLSRDNKGKPRQWTLDSREVSPTPDAATAIWASVIETARIRTDQIRRRLFALIGEGGRKVELKGKDIGEKAALCIKINDEVTAGTIDMFGLLDHALPRSGDGGHKHVECGREYVLGSTDRFFTKDFSSISPTLDFRVTFEVSIGSIRVSRLDFAFGASSIPTSPRSWPRPSGRRCPA